MGKQDIQGRRESILQAGVRASELLGVCCVTRAQVAALAKCSDALITHYFKDFENLRKEVMVEAVQMCNLRIVAQIMAHGGECPVEIPAPLALEACIYISNGGGE